VEEVDAPVGAEEVEPRDLLLVSLDETRLELFVYLAFRIIDAA
tara:strand:- start:236 stop:364 length:129 start_codon:yes stop_codon:yes gene_type:complete